MTWMWVCLLVLLGQIVRLLCPAVMPRPVWGLVWEGLVKWQTLFMYLVFSARLLFHCLTRFSAFSMSLMFCSVKLPHTDSHSDAIQGVRDRTSVEDEDTPAKGWQ